MVKEERPDQVMMMNVGTVTRKAIGLTCAGLDKEREVTLVTDREEDQTLVIAV